MDGLDVVENIVGSIDEKACDQSSKSIFCFWSWVKFCKLSGHHGKVWFAVPLRFHLGNDFACHFVWNSDRAKCVITIDIRRQSVDEWVDLELIFLGCLVENEVRSEQHEICYFVSLSGKSSLHQLQNQSPQTAARNQNFTPSHTMLLHLPNKSFGILNLLTLLAPLSIKLFNSWSNILYIARRCLLLSGLWHIHISFPYQIKEQLIRLQRAL